MRRLSIVIAVLFTVGAHAATPELKTEEQKTLYSLGFAVADSLKGFNLTAAELEYVKAGLADNLLQSKAAVPTQDYMPKIRELQVTRMAAVAAKEKEAGQAFATKAAAEKGATKLPSGVVIKMLKDGTGAMPTASDTVKVHYHGTLTNGTVFDSSVQRNEPATFPLTNVIPCWTEGVQKIKVGGKARLVCPAEVAYGDRGRPPTIGPGATLVFEVELLDIVKPK